MRNLSVLVVCLKVCLWSLLIVPGYLAGPAAYAQTTKLERILFVGNSYLYYNDSLHNHVKRMVAERYPDNRASDFEYKSATIGGARLEHHNIEWLLTPGQIGVNRPFQAVILQAGSHEPLNPSSKIGMLKTMVDYAAQVRKIGAEPLLYMTHAYVPPHRRAEQGMINRIRDAYLEAGVRAGARVIPVGLAFDLSYRERPDFALHVEFDGSHPNLRGTYLAACVVYGALYDSDFPPLDYDYFGRLPKQEALYLQGIARQTLRDFESSFAHD